MTGLDEDAALARYVGAWGLRRPRVLARTSGSDVYLVTADGRDAVLKILLDTAGQDERHAPAALQWFGGNGSARLYRHDAGAINSEP